MYFIYVVENLINGKMYVGQTVDLDRRWSLHLSKSSNCLYLHRAIEKYGTENFEMVIIETLDNQEESNEREKYWISELNTLSPVGYNLKAGGDMGGVPCEETRSRMSASAKNRARGFDEDWRESMRQAQLGRKHSVESKEKMRQSKLADNNPNYGKSPSEETRQKQRAALIGKERSPETVQKMRQSMIGKNKGKVQSEETKKKISAGLLVSNQQRAESGLPHHNVGKIRSEEFRKKVRIALQGRVFSQEHRERISESLRGRKSKHRKELCINNHPLSGTEADIYITPAGARQCRRCKRAVDAKRGGGLRK